MVVCSQSQLLFYFKIITVTEENPTAAAHLSMIKGDRFIQYVSKQIYESKVVEEGIVNQMTATVISKYYSVISKEMKQALKPKIYDKSITRHQGVLNQQRHIVLMNVGAGFFESSVNVAIKILNSKAILID